jgi:hypothetical protein
MDAPHRYAECGFRERTTCIEPNASAKSARVGAPLDTPTRLKTAAAEVAITAFHGLIVTRSLRSVKRIGTGKG